jgi:hypothetical protein
MATMGKRNESLLGAEVSSAICRSGASGSASGDCKFRRTRCSAAKLATGNAAARSAKIAIDMYWFGILGMYEQKRSTANMVEHGPFAVLLFT